MSDTSHVTDNQQASRFELTAGDQVAELVYRRRADRLVLVHTKVPDALEGQGVGGRLVRAAISRAGCAVTRTWPARSPSTGAADPQRRPLAWR
jgi:predicted GNAT family acetyltransferase